MAFENPPASPQQLSGDRSAVNHAAWLETFRKSLQVLQRFVTAMGGGADGVWAVFDEADDVGKVKANTVPNMTVKLRPFWGFVDNVPFLVPDELVTTALVAPTSNPRIDTVVARALPGLEGEFAIHAGTEASSPTAPSIGDGEVLLAWIHHRPGETSIKNTDDSTNGYIEDKRTFTNIAM